MIKQARFIPGEFTHVPEQWVEMNMVFSVQWSSCCIAPAPTVCSALCVQPLQLWSQRSLLYKCIRLKAGINNSPGHWLAVLLPNMSREAANMTAEYYWNETFSVLSWKALILAAFPFISLLLLLVVWTMLWYNSQDVDCGINPFLNLYFFFPININVFFFLMSA